MTLFIDASAFVAMLANEPDGRLFAERVRDDDDPLWSALCCWETVAALQHSFRLDIAHARRLVTEAAAARPLRLVAIGESETVIALDAYERYGKGRHPARLNMGDCFSYACAKTNGAALLYKGNDFDRTDLA